MTQLNEWQLKNDVSDEAMMQLREIFLHQSDHHETETDDDEAAVMASCRVTASAMGGRLWRNNVGAGWLDNGAYMRWGLANDSKRLNRLFKSSDLIGIVPIRITPEMVGHVIGQFWSVECKRPLWKYDGESRDAEQLRWLEIVTALGGRAEFNNSGVLK